MIHDYTDRERSWSQLGDWESCPRKFYLKRIEKVWARPAAWLAMGTAVHAGAEAHGKGEVTDLPGMLEVAQKVYRATINRDLEKTPNPEYWYSSGRYRGPEDIFRRYGLLTKHLENYLKAPMGDPWRPEGPQGPPAIEWGFQIDLDGVPVIGFADRIDVGSGGQLCVVDVKSGSTIPKDPIQLRVYALAVEDVTGEPVTKGAYLMTKDGKAREHDLVTISTESLTERFHKLDAGVKAEEWTPKTSKDCQRCEVLTSCVTGQDYLRSG